MTIYCELYTIEITNELFLIKPKIDTLDTITLKANEGEDFSLFELGPAIASNVIMQTNKATIGNAVFDHVCLEVVQNPGHFISITIRQARPNRSVPVNSGEVITVIKDYMIKFE